MTTNLTVDLRLASPGLERVRILLAGRGIPANGDLETAFLDTAEDIRRHIPGRPLAEVLRLVCDRPDTDTVVVIRNPQLVLDDGLAGRLVQALGQAGPTGTWAVAAAGGLGLGERRHVALYASATPAIPLPQGVQPIIDPLPDLTLLDAAHARTLLADGTPPDDTALELVLTVEGYLAGLVSVAVPALTAGIDGPLLARDLRRLDVALTARFADRLAGQTIATLSGPFALPAEPPGTGPSQYPAAHLDEVITDTIARRIYLPSLSIVTRTRFDRPHLLRRLLTSIWRARRPDLALEVVLSTDADPMQAQAETAALTATFPGLAIRLQQNAGTGPSRTANLTGGIRAASHDYVAIVDDDDYLDLFAFDALAEAFFDGNRPVVATASEVHRERWEVPGDGHAILTETQPAQGYAAAGWRRMFTGVNQLPVCALVLPRDFAVRRLDAVTLAHDLSEDYAVFLLFLTAQDLPAIHEIERTFCHISLRGLDNSVTMPDRRPWCRDIAGHLATLTGSAAVTGPGTWALLAEAAPAAPHAVADLRHALDRAETDVRLLRRETERLRAELAIGMEAAE